MKNVVFYDTGREVEFKPDAIFKEYLKLNENDLNRWFEDKKGLLQSVCPACRSDKSSKVFDKLGFEYVECQECQTVYMALRPKDEDIKDHYLNSVSSHFWRENLSRSTEEKRKEKVYGPRLQWIIEMMDEYFPKAQRVADLSDKNMDYVRFFLNYPYFTNKIVIDPYFDVKEIAGAQVIHDLAEARKNKESVEVVSAFDVIEYTADVNNLMDTIREILVPGGLCFITTISISGFDLQVLWGESKTIFPLDRINIFSSKGLKILFERYGFEILEYSTPGLLDLDIVMNAMKKDKQLSVPRFVKTLVEQGDEQLYREFQEFLQTNKLSSFTRILLSNNKILEIGKVKAI